MGAGAGQKQGVKNPEVSTVTGRLKITVTNASLFHKGTFFKINPYVKLKLSNQIRRTKVIPKGNTEPKFNETFTFFINSCHKIHGRSLKVLVMDENKIGPESEVGYGVIDLDPLINQKKEKQDVRCFITHNRQPAGVINLVCYFIEQVPKTISFNFQNALIRRRTCTFTHMHSWVDIEVTIGEDTVRTSRAKDKKNSLPSWPNEVLKLNCFEGIKDCIIRVYDDQKEVGSLKMDTAELINLQQEQFFSEEFYDKDGTNTGTLKFKTMAGQSPQFSHIKVSQKTSRASNTKDFSLENVQSSILFDEKVSEKGQNSRISQKRIGLQDQTNQQQRISNN